MTEEERKAAAILRLRLAGIDPSWIRYALIYCKYDANAMELWAENAEKYPEANFMYTSACTHIIHD